MYFNKKNNFSHGIMFHHFHDKKGIHKKTQGSISAKKFEEIIKFIGPHNICSPEEFITTINKKNKKLKVCLTFDDALKCQYDIAKPVMDKYNIKAFYFIYTSIFTPNVDLLEVYRYFRVNAYSSIKQFYNEFYKEIKFNLDFYFKLHKDKIILTKKKFPFYTIEDIKFRLIRDLYLSKKEYEKIMINMMNKKNFNYKKQLLNLFLTKKNIKNLYNEGNIIGLHSHTHPTHLEDMSYLEQTNEYHKNSELLYKIINDPIYKINSMSHPCGSYNFDTLNILNKLNIDIGFKQIMTVEKNRNMKKINNTNLEIARIDHSILLKQLNSK